MKCLPLIVFCAACLLAACSPLAVAPTPLSSAPALVQPTPRLRVAPAITTIPEPQASPDALVLWAVATEPQREALQRLVTELNQQIGTEIVVVAKSADGVQPDLRAN